MGREKELVDVHKILLHFQPSIQWFTFLCLMWQGCNVQWSWNQFVIFFANNSVVCWWAYEVTCCLKLHCLSSTLIWKTWFCVGVVYQNLSLSTFIISKCTQVYWLGWHCFVCLCNCPLPNNCYWYSQYYSLSQHLYFDVLFNLLLLMSKAWKTVLIFPDN